MPSSEEKKQPFAAWNEAGSLSAYIKAFLPLCSQILFKPVDFFKQVFLSSPSDKKKRIISAIIFAVVLGYFKLFFDAVNYEAAQAQFFSQAVLASPLFLLRPVFVFVATLVLVAIGVKLIFGLDKPLTGAFFIVCYRSVADLFYCLPFVGSIFAIAWSFALLVVGLREAYKSGILRSLAAGIIMPAVILFFTLVGMGPALNRAIFYFYPEMKAQMAKINDVTAYAYTSAIVSAADEYKKDLGFYPVHLGVLGKYLSSSIISDATKPASGGGYNYEYARIDDLHYRLLVRPITANITGRFVFYANEAGDIRLGGPQGELVKNLKDMETRILSN